MKVQHICKFFAELFTINSKKKSSKYVKKKSDYMNQDNKEILFKFKSFVLSTNVTSVFQIGLQKPVVSPDITRHDHVPLAVNDIELL